MSLPHVAVVIPTIPARADLLSRALSSVEAQDFTGNISLYVETDTKGEGPAVMRNRGIEAAWQAGAEYVAFLDDDDCLYPNHISQLVTRAQDTGSDVIYPWFDIVTDGRVDNRRDPLGRFGEPFDADALRRNNYIPVTALVRAYALWSVRGFPQPRSPEWPHADCEDWGLWLRLLDNGATFHHLPRRTWAWNWHPRNTSGKPENAARLYGQ